MNKCSAVTYLFYKLNKLQRISFKLVAIERRVYDPKTPTGANQRLPLDTTGRITVLPQSIPATRKDRLEVEKMARTSAAEYLQAAASTVGPVRRDIIPSAVIGPARVATVSEEPTFDAALRRDAIAAVDKDLATYGILDDRTGELNRDFVKDLSWERVEVLPTPGVLVKGCLDQCNTCEPARRKEIELDLEHKRLENEMLKRQIEILEKSQEYRCCPGESVKAEMPSDG